MEDHKLEAIIYLPSGVFKPYSGVSTAILIFTKTNAGGTDNVWLYNMESDGYTLDDKRVIWMRRTTISPIFLHAGRTLVPSLSASVLRRASLFPSRK